MTGSKSSSDPLPGVAPPRIGRVRAAGLLAALITALVLALFAGASLRNMVFDSYQQMYPRDLSNARVSVVQIDAESLRVVGQWPWSRYHLARLTEQIAARGATAIGFDILFPEPDRLSPDQFTALYLELPPLAARDVNALPSMDETFATVIGRNAVVLARAGIDEQSVDYSERIYDDPSHLPVEARFVGAVPAGIRSFPRAVANIPTLEEVALGHGLINGLPDGDGIVRRMPLIARVAGQPTPGFALELARIASDAEDIGVQRRRNRLTGVTLGAVAVPAEADGRFRVHFGDIPAKRIHSAADLLRRNYAAPDIAGSVVLISLASAGTVDVATTPLVAQTYGVLVQAQTVDAILRGGWLVRPAWASILEWALGVVMAIAAIMLIPKLRGPVAVLLPAGVIVVVLVGSWIAFTAFRTLIDPLQPLLLAAAPGLAVFLLLFVEAGRIQRRLRMALDSERVQAARAAGELEAAQDIQRGMLPEAKSLAKLDPAIDLAAMLEPARTVGGDFFDAFATHGGRTCFVIGDVTGKGVPAALFMALSKAVARSVLSRWSGELSSAITVLNDDLARDNSEAMFVTMLIGVLDSGTGKLFLCNAGHENPILMRADGSVTELAMEGGPPLCVVEGYDYPIEIIDLAPGDGLIAVTDGVTEAQSPAGGFFERDGVLGVLRSLGPDWRADQATTALTRAVRDFEGGGEPSDDLTILAMRYGA